MPVAAPVFTTPASIAPNEAAPLAPTLGFETDVPTRATVVIADGTRSFEVAFPDLATDHLHLLLGFRPGRDHTVTVRATRAEGTSITSAPLAFRTAPLPTGFPPITLQLRNAAAMEPGVTLFPLDSNPLNFHYLVFIDDQAEVVWYAKVPHAGDTRRAPNGNLVSIDGSFNLLEIDMRGRIVRRWHAGRLEPTTKPGDIHVAADTFHHDAAMLPSGNLLALSTELREIAGYPTDETDLEAPTETANVVGDRVIEFAPDGTMVGSWSMLDVVDPSRIGYTSLSGFWNGQYAGVAGATRDWSHGNAVVLDAASDALVVSLRHQDAVVKVRRATGELVWILGNHDNWRAPWSAKLLTPLEGLSWQYHQHAAKVLPGGNILLYDNGNFRASPPATRLPAEDNHSRAVEFAVNEAAMTVAQVWSYGGPADEIFYSPFICDADRLPVTGNVLITDGGRVVDGDGTPSDLPAAEGNHTWARLVEVTHTTPAVKVWEVQIGNPDPDSESWTVYRSERLPGLYP